MDLDLGGLPGVYQRSDLVFCLQCRAVLCEDRRGEEGGAEVESRHHDDVLLFGLKIYENKKGPSLLDGSRANGRARPDQDKLMRVQID